MKLQLKYIFKSPIIVIALFLIIPMACRDQKKAEVKIKPAQKTLIEGPGPYAKLMNNEKERKRLWKAAIDSGNCEAYNKVAIAYLMTYNEVELYYCSLIMANKYQCPEAYRNMSAILTHEASAGDTVILSHDHNTENLANYYLFKAYELGSELAKNDIEVEFGKERLKTKSSFYLKKLIHP